MRADTRFGSDIGVRVRETISTWAPKWGKAWSTGTTEIPRLRAREEKKPQASETGSQQSPGAMATEDSTETRENDRHQTWSKGPDKGKAGEKAGAVNDLWGPLLGKAYLQKKINEPRLTLGRADKAKRAAHLKSDK